eukprot:CAMPEP_0119570612 /NCGR_PEP_ID=MMETSP1352-20130426/43701_1 /TAXON_ID=265584 /ORGANISM="Stauroneis constricta, Strain CCMP1120" /LENGTH=860 /DNA_ID=CAMNT_0007620281 /DNA_START=252 /DNA_END=2834 /DNA_ORIENTATION=-
MRKNAVLSSNLAALCLHVVLQMQALTKKLMIIDSDDSDIAKHDRQRSFADASVLIHAAKMAAGSIKLFGHLVHDFIARHSSNDDEDAKSNTIREALIYCKQRNTDNNNDIIQTNDHLIDSILDLLSFFATTSANTRRQHECLLRPEVYDAVTFATELLIIMLSVQLYQPFVSSFTAVQDSSSSQRSTTNLVLDYIMKKQQQTRGTVSSSLSVGRKEHLQLSESTWNPSTVTSALLALIATRPEAPKGSIAHYMYELSWRIARSTKESMAKDGIYDSSHIVIASQNARLLEKGGSSTSTARQQKGKHASLPGDQHHNDISEHEHSMISDATSSILRLSSSVVLLPVRLVQLVIGLLGKGQLSSSSALLLDSRFSSHAAGSHMSEEVLWITESPVADVSMCIFVLLGNNLRNDAVMANPFRNVLKSMIDERWEDHQDQIALVTGGATSQQQQNKQATPEMNQNVRINFETLIGTLGQTMHTESSCLLLYTLLQSSPAFAETICVRSDRDTLIGPILRRLYNYTSSRLHTSTTASRRTRINNRNRFNSNNGNSTVQEQQQQQQQKRSTSHIYVSLINILIFSQDISFGNDIFQRTYITTNITWYKERQLKNMNFGSLLILCILRCIVLFGLRPEKDTFIVNNCCAILTNLSSTIMNIHEYTAMRFVSITVNALKRQKSNNDDDNIQQIIDTCFYILHQSLSTKSKIIQNLHLLYAIVYYQMDFTKYLPSPKKSKEMKYIQSLMNSTKELLSNSSRSANDAMNILRNYYDQKETAVTTKDDKYQCSYHEDDYDTEQFFIPYIWNMIVNTTCSSSSLWQKDRIVVFTPMLLLDEDDEDSVKEDVASSVVPQTNGKQHNTDVDAMV